MENHVVIMAGGVGSRFWPISTPEYPKQFVDVLGYGKTMIQMTVERFQGICPMSNFWVVTSADYVDIVRAQLPDLPVENILAEPCARNTAPCIAYACWKIRLRHPEANVVVTPADALVLDVPEFRRIISEALEFAAGGERIVTLGIKPTRPETGYGYIAAAYAGPGDGPDDGPGDGSGDGPGDGLGDGPDDGPDDGPGDGPDDGLDDGLGDGQVGGIVKVESFREKPCLEVAQQYLAAGNYFWNAGIFVWSVETIVESLRRYTPELAAKMDVMSESFYTEAEPAVVGELFPTCEKISIDYAVMEKADYIYTCPSDFGWSDVGTWGSLWTLLPHDENGNAVVGSNVHLYGCRGCIVHAPAAASVVLEGIEDSIVVEREGRILVCRLSEEQRIKEFEK
jgi:mannose-1-phosphate guanylyltransferase